MPDLTNAKGKHTGAVYGFLSILFRILDEEQADYLTVAFDEHAPTFRHEMFAAYKGTRHAMPDELREQVPLIKEVLQAMDIKIISKPGLEADDILGTLAKRAQAEGMEVTLVSGDRDLLQIADDHILIRIPKTKRGQTTIENYHRSDVKEQLLVTPEEFIEVKALQGDTSDNIPGVPKVGPKTATDLIVKYHSVAGVYEHLDEITRKALHDTLEANRAQAELSLRLATIKTDCELDCQPEDAKIRNFYTPAAFELYTELGFKNYLGRFDKTAAGAAQTPASEMTQTVVLDQAALADAVDKAKEVLKVGGTIGVYPVYDRDSVEPSRVLLGAAIAVSEADVYFAPAVGDLTEITQEMITTSLGTLRALCGASGTVATFDIKPGFAFWDINEDTFTDRIALDGILDVLLGAYLCNPLKNDYELEDVAAEYAGVTLSGKKTLLGKLTFAEKLFTAPDEVYAFACQNAAALVKVAPLVKARLSDMKMWELYETMELPLTYVLYDMERIGIRVLPDKLRQYGQELTGRIAQLEASIHAAAGEDFNIASPKQLGEILFDKMGLKGGKKTKTGWSTAADVLEKLAPEYPFVADVLEYRGLTKLKSTYAEGLAAYIAGDERIHTSFNQTITATGRISSTEPNLQNIPMRTELGRAIRKVFVPKDGYSFRDADYSQIELRILASMSGDEALIEAYRQGDDIHRMTASRVFGVPFDEVTDLQRRNAKAVNFGIVYGISSFGLSQGLSITRAEASDYIKQYFKMFPGIKAFLDKQVEDAKEDGYSVTLFGRRRPIPELKSSNFMQRQFGERVAMNAPIQGTGADIMKRAMIRVWENLHSRKLQSRLILQIHDELLIETAPGEEAAVEEILKDGMMGAASLRVPLLIDCHGGSDWYEAK